MGSVSYSRHALRRMALRGISRSEVEDAIRKGAKRRQDGRLVASYRYFEVVFVAEGDDIRVVTVQPRW